MTGAKVRLRLRERSRVLIGYVDDRGVEWLAPPSLETDTHADDRGGYAPVLIHAAKAKGVKAFNVHAFLYDAGDVTLDYGTGAYTVVGVVPESAPLIPREAGLDAESLATLDWLYEDEAGFDGAGK